MAKKWFTNGIIEKFMEEDTCLEGFYRGRKPVSNETRQKQSENNGMHKLTIEQQTARANKIAHTKQQRTQDEIDRETAKAKQTFMAHYGVDNPMKVQDIKDKLKNSCLEKYGTDNPAKSKDVQEKIKQTSLKKYGVENVFAADEIKQQIKETNLEKYGVDNYQKTNEAREKAKKQYVLNKEFILLKIKETCLKKYGVTNYAKTAEAKAFRQAHKDELIAKTISTNLTKYGARYYSQTNAFNVKIKKHYLLNDQYFDSFPELALYLYAIVNNIEIIRNPVKFEYIFENKIHCYFPDFKFDGRLVELKGDHFFKDNRMINPFDRSQDDLYEAKHQCGINNGVEFWLKADYQPYIDWFINQGFKKEDFSTKNK